jgi:hypothetical protein
MVYTKDNRENSSSQGGGDQQLPGKCQDDLYSEYGPETG